MNSKIIVGAGLLLTSMASFAQLKYSIWRIDAFFTERTPGNIPVDDNGNPVLRGPDTITTIYIEVAGRPVKWISAWKNGKSYSVTTTAVNERPVEVGVNKCGNEKVILKPTGKNKLWLLQLEKDETPSSAPVKARAGEIILRGKAGGKTIIQRIRSQTELVSIPSV